MLQEKEEEENDEKHENIKKGTAVGALVATEGVAEDADTLAAEDIEQEVLWEVT